MPFVHSISGLRATLGDALKPDVLSRFCAAFSKICPPGKIYIGRDGRPSGAWIERIVEGTLAAAGREIVVLGVVPTPTVQLMVEKNRSAGGIIITASHNPKQWNGLKFLNSSGVFLDKQENYSLTETLASDIQYSESTAPPDVEHSDDAINQHVKAILSLPQFKKKSILESIRGRKFKVAVDAVNASGSEAVCAELEAFGCEVVKLYCDGSGVFPREPEPIPINLQELAKTVKELRCDFGVAVDPDADRLVLVDENGETIGEELTIVLATESVLSFLSETGEASGAKVVVNHSTTRLVEDVCLKYEAEVVRSAVGEINVVKKMKSVGAVLGGEGSGGVIYPECHYGRDSLVGIALLLYLLDKENFSLSLTRRVFPHYENVKLKQPFEGDLKELIEKFAATFKDAKIDKEDGVKAEFEKSWVQLRASNTEPIIRIISEAPGADEAESLAKKVINLCS